MESIPLLPPPDVTMLPLFVICALAPSEAMPIAKFNVVMMSPLLLILASSPTE